MSSSKVSDKEKYQAAYLLVNEGEYKEAINLAGTLEDELARAAIFIDAGCPLKKIGIVRSAAQKFEEAATKEKR